MSKYGMYDKLTEVIADQIDNKDVEIHLIESIGVNGHELVGHIVLPFKIKDTSPQDIIDEFLKQYDKLTNNLKLEIERFEDE
jgi:hypothetical protein